MSAGKGCLVAVAACLAVTSLAEAQATCPDGFVSDGPRCLRTSATPPIRWRAAADAELYTLDPEVSCVAPAGGRCDEVAGLEVPLIWGILLLSTGYAGSIGVAAATGSIDRIAPYDGDAAINVIPLVGPTIATVVAYESGGNAVAQFAFGLLSSALQLGGTILTLIGALGTRTVTRDREGRVIELAGGLELRFAGPTGFALAF